MDGDIEALNVLLTYFIAGHLSSREDGEEACEQLFLACKSHIARLRREVSDSSPPNVSEHLDSTHLALLRIEQLVRQMMRRAAD